ncbi:MAG: DUF1385 domain-containing protein [Anaerolineae bacterium]|nr:DUF1385 domain-containing protein [Anaerolineae bacterium]
MKFSYGGQAVIEGVMMRGAHTAAVAVRDPKGQIVVHETELNRTLYRGRIIKTPFVRGVVGLWDALGLGTRALMWAADVAVGEEEEVNFNGPIGWATIAISLLIGVGVFFLLPTIAASGIGNVLGLSTSYVVEVPADGSAAATTAFDLGPLIINLIEGVIQLTILIGYIWLIGRIPDVKRLFGYHGAEHKTINAYEAGAELTPEVVSQYPIEHPRCGTAFLLTVALVSVFVFSLLGRPPFLLLILSRVVLIPVIAGIAYELIQWTARNMHRPWVRTMIKPNLALQHLTTRQPELHMIEVAIVAFKRVLVSEKLLNEAEAIIPAPRPEAVSPTMAGGD